MELDWWDTSQLSEEVALTATPAQHYSGRGLFDCQRTLWAGYVISGPSGVAYFAGDTGWGPHFQQVRERFGPVRLAILPIGAYKPEWFMHPIHISPKEAVNAHEVLEVSVSGRCITALSTSQTTGRTSRHTPCEQRFGRRRCRSRGFGRSRSARGEVCRRCGTRPTPLANAFESMRSTSIMKSRNNIHKQCPKPNEMIEMTISLPPSKRFEVVTQFT